MIQIGPEAWGQPTGTSRTADTLANLVERTWAADLDRYQSSVESQDRIIEVP